MVKDNDQFAREKELAREYEKKMSARDKEIKALMTINLRSVPTHPNEIRNFSTLFKKLYLPAFSAWKNSEGF